MVYGLMNITGTECNLFQIQKTLFVPERQFKRHRAVYMSIQTDYKRRDRRIDTLNCP